MKFGSFFFFFFFFLGAENTSLGARLPFIFWKGERGERGTSLRAPHRPPAAAALRRRPQTVGKALAGGLAASCAASGCGTRRPWRGGGWGLRLGGRRPPSGKLLLLGRRLRVPRTRGCPETLNVAPRGVLGPTAPPAGRGPLSGVPISKNGSVGVFAAAAVFFSFAAWGVPASSPRRRLSSY